MLALRGVAAVALSAGIFVQACPAQTLKVTGVRFWPLGDTVRVAIEVDGPFRFRHDRLDNPPRLFFDILDSTPAMVQRGTRTVPVGEGLVRQVRIAENQRTITRVVLDLSAPADFTTSELVNPNRLIVEVKPAASAPPVPVVAIAPPVKPAPKIFVPPKPQPKAPVQVAMIAPPVLNPAHSRLPQPPRISWAPLRFPSPPPKPVEVVKAEAPKPEPPATPQRAAATPPPKPVEFVKAEAPKPEPPATPQRAAATPPPKPVEFVKAEAPKPEPPATPHRAVATPPPKPVEVVKAAAPKPEPPATPHRAVATPPPNLPVTSATAPPLPRDVVPTPAKRGVISGDQSMTRVLGLKIGRVVIDPGHGGHDTGTIGPKGLTEKDLVLDVAKRVGELIETRMGSEVIYTRSDDRFIPLEARTEVANEMRADLFLSIHANSSQLRTASGSETFYLNFTTSRADLEVAARENSSSQRSVFELKDMLEKIALKDKVDESREFAAKVQTALYSVYSKGNPKLRNRGVKKAPFVVLIGASMPSILAEIGFVSNPRDEAMLNKSDQRQKIAEALFKGLSAYAGTLSHFQVAKRGE